MSAQDFLVELGTEELPPKALKSLGDAFLAGIEKGLKAAGLSYAKAHVYAAPRRLAVRVDQLAAQQPDRTVNLDGPPVQAAFDADGNPTQAALGFAKKCGVELSQIDRSGPKLKFSQSIAGQPAASLLPGIVEASLNDLPIPKRMRWGARKTEFVRPSQWLVMLFGDSVIDCEILAQKAGRVSRGHRFHANRDVHISSPASYAEDLRGAYVIADFAERRRLIDTRVAELAAAEQGSAIVPPALLDEVSALVEWPVPLVCSFEERFLEVPQEALITTMQDNQKYFCLLDGNGKLLPRFITVANIESKDPAQIVAGNEKVVRPRLTDAEFFFKQDKKQKLESFNQRLQNVVFQAQLGTVFDKAERISRLAAFIAERIGGDAALAGIDVALAADAGIQFDHVVVVDVVAQQAADVAVAHAFAAGRRGHAGGKLFIERQGIRLGLVDVAEQAERQLLAQRARQLEANTLAVAFVTVLGLAAVQGQRAGQVTGRLLGDDIDHATGSARTITCSSGATQYFDAFHRFGRHPVAVAAAVAFTAAAHAHRIARAHRAAIDQDQGVFRAHATDVDLAEIAVGARRGIAGQVDAGHAPDHLGQIVGRWQTFQIDRSDHRAAQGLLGDLFGGDVHGVDIGGGRRTFGQCRAGEQGAQRQRSRKGITGQQDTRGQPRRGTTGHGQASRQ